MLNFFYWDNDKLFLILDGINFLYSMLYLMRLYKTGHTLAVTSCLKRALLASKTGVRFIGNFCR